MVPGSTGYGMPTGFPARKVKFESLNVAFQMFMAQMSPWLLASLILFGILLVPMLIWFVGGGAVMATIMATAHGQEPGPPLMMIPVLFLVGIVVFLAVAYAYALGMGGMFHMALKQFRGEPLQATDIFGAKDMVWPLFVAFLLLGLASMAGALLCFVGACVVAGLMMLTMPLIIDQRLSPTEAISKSWSVLKEDWLMATCYYFIVTFIGGLLGPFTMPIMVLGVTAVYHDFFLSDAGPTGAFSQGAMVDQFGQPYPPQPSPERPREGGSGYDV